MRQREQCYHSLGIPSLHTIKQWRCQTVESLFVHLRLCDFRHDTPLNPPASADKEEDLSNVGSGLQKVERVLCKQSGGWQRMQLLLPRLLPLSLPLTPTLAAILSSVSMAGSTPPHRASFTLTTHILMHVNSTRRIRPSYISTCSVTRLQSGSSCSIIMYWRTCFFCEEDYHIEKLMQ